MSDITPEGSAADESSEERRFEELGRLAGAAVRRPVPPRLVDEAVAAGQRQRRRRSIVTGTIIVVAVGALVAAITSLSSRPTVPVDSVSPTAPATTSTIPPVEGPLMVGESQVGAGYGTYVYDAKGQKIRRLDDPSGSALKPDPSPDGKLVVFTNSDDTLWLVGIDGANAHQLLACDKTCDALDNAAFSPDGRRIAFTAAVAAAGPPASTTIRVLDLDTMVTTDVVTGKYPALVDVPRWSPDGARLVVGLDYFDDHGDEIGSSIAVVAVSGGAVTPLVDQAVFAYAPDWNHVTGEIVYSTETREDRAGGIASGDTWDLHGIQADGSAGRTITSVAAGQRLKMPYWTLDGKSLLAVFYKDGIYSEVRIDATTGALTEISTGVGTHVRQVPET